MTKLHICILSDQLLPNYLAIKYYKPDAVFLIETSYTKAKGLGERLQRLTDDNLHNAPTFHIAKELAPDNDFNKLSRYFQKISLEIKKLQAKETILNLTGGTKLMALAAYDTLEKISQNIIYINTQDEKITFITPSSAPSKTLPSLLSIKEYLTAYGVFPQESNNDNPTWEKTVYKRRELTIALAKFFSDKNQGFLSPINALAQKALNTVSGPNRKPVKYLENLKHFFKSSNTPSQKQILFQCANNGLIRYDGDREIIFQTAEAASYLGGFWLEEYVYLMLQEAKIEEVQCGVTLLWDKKNKNELDIVAIQRNRLLIIECKTRQYGKATGQDNETIYKLDSIADDLQGLYGETWLLSARTINKATIQRAASQGITVISGKEIQPENLKKRITQWIHNKKQ